MSIGPMYPSLIPRYVDSNWFSSEHMLDEDLELSDIESQRGHFTREGYANRGSHPQAPRSEIPYDEEDHDEDDEDDDADDVDDVDEDDEEEAEQAEEEEADEEESPRAT